MFSEILSSILDVARDSELHIRCCQGFWAHLCYEISQKVIFWWVNHLGHLKSRISYMWSRFKTPVNNKDGTICINSLLLKVINYSIFTRSFVLDDGRVLDLSVITMIFCKSSWEVLLFTEPASKDISKISFFTQFVKNRYEVYCKIRFLLIHMLRNV